MAHLAHLGTGPKSAKYDKKVTGAFLSRQIKMAAYMLGGHIVYVNLQLSLYAAAAARLFEHISKTCLVFK